MILKSLFSSPPRDTEARTVYAQIVAQARQPAFYATLGVPDTLEGRYDLLVLHAFLVMRRLKGGAAGHRELAQQVFDLMFLDMDRSLRELGVGDVSVGKRIKKMAQVFYGRTGAYDAALDAADDGALVTALTRNVYDGSPPSPDGAARLARYVRGSARLLDGISDDAVLGGDIGFAALRDGAGEQGGEDD